MFWELKMLPTTASIHLHIILVLCIFNLISFTSAGLTFAQWGKPCKIPNPKLDELIDLRLECDVGKGLVCEAYTQGVFCGCKAGGALTYDRSSGECRRKVAAECHITNSIQEYDELPFNRKCHKNAECIRYNGTLIGTTESSSTDKMKLSRPICLCKAGYVATRDLTSCVDPSGSSSLAPISLFFTTLISYVFLKILA